MLHLTSLLTTSLTLDNCWQIHLWRDPGFPWEAHPQGGNYDWVKRFGRCEDHLL